MGKRKARRREPESPPVPTSPVLPKVYEVRYHLAAEKQLLVVPDPYRRQLARRIAKLKDDPRSQADKLSGVDLYKIRQGDYRAIFVIEDKAVIVLVVKVGHRREVYEKLAALAKGLGQ